MSAAGVTKEIDQFMDWVVRRNPGEPEFHQAVHEVVETLMPFVLEHERYREAKILERMCEPDRVITFRVTWVDDDGEIHVNRAWRVQFNNSIGPYKGGLRFHPTVTLGTLKFLGFEQTFKNALTGLPMGGAKGGANFDPKGKSDNEVMSFCQSLMVELSRHIGENTDIPAGDIGVGAREIGFMYGQYKRLVNRVAGVLTGKGLSFGGSRVRKEATGYGVVYFTEHMLEHIGEGFEGKTAAVSGSGNVAIYTIEKLVEKGAKVVTASDSSGFVHDPDGIDEEKLAWLRDLKEVRRGRIHEYADHFDSATFQPKTNPWVVPVDLAFPCATQNELTGEDARTLVKNGIIAVGEGANMPTEPEGVQVFLDAKICYGLGKAANAGGVAVSGLEMSQNAIGLSWTHAQVDAELKKVMRSIHEQCVEHGDEGDFVNYPKGANVAGFIKVADAMLAYGAV
ncbi:MAG: NADP-specific glutamate dehydrogenase [Gemmatimonadota bacterium]|jgi:glutamate dehydrogenase (NADP+)|nr:MAG: NADP-specific glutamate dehydrogenase [Gemmatimonadota bacterium]